MSGPAGGCGRGGSPPATWRDNPKPKKIARIGVVFIVIRDGSQGVTVTKTSEGLLACKSPSNNAESGSQANSRRRRNSSSC